MPRWARQLVPKSLRWRLTAWVAAVMLVAAAVIFLVVYQQTGARLRAQIDRSLSANTSQLAQLVSSLHGRSPRQITQAVDRYLAAQPYTATSTLLFVLVPGQPTASNHPEVFGSDRLDVGETTAEQFRENQEGRRLLEPRIGFSTRRVPDVGSIRLHEVAVPTGGDGVLVGAGLPLESVEQAQRGILRAILIASGLTLGLALLASYLAGARVSSPLRRMATVAARVDAGDLEPRMTGTASSGAEVRVLADAFNHMLDRLSSAFASQREFIADASHELRTPLTVIRGQLEVLAAQQELCVEDVRRAERLVRAEITRISRLVDDMLLLAQAERDDFLRPEPIDLPEFVGDLWDGVSLTADRRFELGSVPAGSLRADPDRLAQALRNLASNAVNHTREGSGLVRLQVERTGGDRVRFIVLDDGPGIPAAERERVFERFHRTTSSRAARDGGAGLGLAIVRAIAEAHGGHVRVVSADGAGARVELELPGLRPDAG
jgi:two-component system OmpR family sensor kinase